MKHIESFIDFEMITENRKYDHINFIPPLTVSNQSKKGLKYRKRYKLTPGELSVKRARKLIDRDKISPHIIKQMCTFFSRHRSRNILDKYKTEPWKDRKYVTHLLWGGDSGRAWAEKVRTQMARSDKK